MRAMGRNSSKEDIGCTFGIAVMIASFHTEGTTLVESNRLKIVVIGIDNSYANSLITWSGIQSGPHDLDDLSRNSLAHTSIGVIIGTVSGAGR